MKRSGGISCHEHTAEKERQAEKRSKNIITKLKFSLFFSFNKHLERPLFFHLFARNIRQHQLQKKGQKVYDVTLHPLSMQRLKDIIKIYNHEGEKKVKIPRKLSGR